MALEARWDLVEADFQRYYRLDLRQEIHTSGVRRLSALVEGLAPDSALNRDGLWTQADELAAVMIERHELWSRILVAMWADKASKLPDAIAIAHPDRPVPDAAPTKKPASPAQIAAMFGPGR